MKKIIVCLALVLGLAPISDLSAHADTPAALVDAGAGSDHGSAASTATPSPAPSPPVIAPLPDPISHPLDFIASLKQLWAISWGLAIGAVALALAELAAFLGKNVASLAFLGTGRVSIVIGGVIAVLTTGIASITGSSSFGWVPFLTAIGGAVLAYWHNAATPEAIALVDKAKAAALPIATLVKSGGA